ncbi:trimeric LpxA-like protein [Pseudovirgaria hyperparasitica]|uniref:Trimeric LpxA-like protein n=1 Tax=Pseudovirgaria hyperparasitica TaxID=470096 RepID=A0A6A6VRD9_9PEZI|nr:trimeric LpxA-like protein [Pseudovirgaria hyperparasitica]KAF2752459.1 trimeric LpxA-like protein [Pseudovirgaria hyperparasitica]
MLNGQSYSFFAMQLVTDHRLCKERLKQFDYANSCPELITEHFRSVLCASDIRYGPDHPESVQGTMGHGVIIEDPFSCDYGYNIHIGDNVMIGSNCTILDACKVCIGNDTVIGPNVTLAGYLLSDSPQRRRGFQSKAQGGEINIQENCAIGANVTVLPGVTIGRGAMIRPGSIIVKDIPPCIR